MVNFILSYTPWSCLIFHIQHFLITYSVIASFSVLVVSIVRWRHLKEQVSQLVFCFLLTCLLACLWFGGMWFLLLCFMDNICITNCCCCCCCAFLQQSNIFCVYVQVHLLVQLALADLLAALILLSATVINKVNTDNNVAICKFILPLSLVRNIYCHSDRHFGVWLRYVTSF